MTLSKSVLEWIKRQGEEEEKKKEKGKKGKTKVKETKDDHVIPEADIAEAKRLMEQIVAKDPNFRHQIPGLNEPLPFNKMVLNCVRISHDLVTMREMILASNEGLTNYMSTTLLQFSPDPQIKVLNRENLQAVMGLHEKLAEKMMAHARHVKPLCDGFERTALGLKYLHDSLEPLLQSQAEEGDGTYQVTNRMYDRFMKKFGDCMNKPRSTLGLPETDLRYETGELDFDVMSANCLTTPDFFNQQVGKEDIAATTTTSAKEQSETELRREAEKLYEGVTKAARYHHLLKDPAVLKRLGANLNKMRHFPLRDDEGESGSGGISSNSNSSSSSDPRLSEQDMDDYIALIEDLKSTISEQKHKIMQVNPLMRLLSDPQIQKHYASKFKRKVSQSNDGDDDEGRISEIGVDGDDMFVGGDGGGANFTDANGVFHIAPVNETMDWLGTERDYLDTINFDFVNMILTFIYAMVALKGLIDNFQRVTSIARRVYNLQKRVMGGSRIASAAHSAWNATSGLSSYVTGIFRDKTEDVSRKAKETETNTKATEIKKAKETKDQVRKNPTGGGGGGSSSPSPSSSSTALVISSSALVPSSGSNATATAAPAPVPVMGVSGGGGGGGGDDDPDSEQNYGTGFKWMSSINNFMYGPIISPIITLLFFIVGAFLTWKLVDAIILNPGDAIGPAAALTRFMDTMFGWVMSDSIVVMPFNYVTSQMNEVSKHIAGIYGEYNQIIQGNAEFTQEQLVHMVAQGLLIPGFLLNNNFAVRNTLYKYFVADNEISMGDGSGPAMRAIGTLFDLILSPKIFILYAQYAFLSWVDVNPINVIYSYSGSTATAALILVGATSLMIMAQQYLVEFNQRRLNSTRKRLDQIYTLPAQSSIWHKMAYELMNQVREVGITIGAAQQTTQDYSRKSFMGEVWHDIIAHRSDEAENGGSGGSSTTTTTQNSLFRYSLADAGVAALGVGLHLSINMLRYEIFLCLIGATSFQLAQSQEGFKYQKQLKGLESLSDQAWGESRPGNRMALYRYLGGNYIYILGALNGGIGKFMKMGILNIFHVIHKAWDVLYVLSDFSLLRDTALEQSQATGKDITASEYSQLQWDPTSSHAFHTEDPTGAYDTGDEHIDEERADETIMDVIKTTTSKALDNSVICQVLSGKGKNPLFTCTLVKPGNTHTGITSDSLTNLQSTFNDIELKLKSEKYSRVAVQNTLDKWIMMILTNFGKSKGFNFPGNMSFTFFGEKPNVRLTYLKVDTKGLRLIPTTADDLNLSWIRFEITKVETDREVRVPGFEDSYIHIYKKL